MTATHLGWALVCGGLIGLAVIGVCRLVAAFDRRASETIRKLIDTPLLYDDWCDDEDQAIGVTRDGSHDGADLSPREESAWREITREYHREAS